MPDALDSIKAEALSDQPLQPGAEQPAQPAGAAPTDEQRIENEARGWAEIPAMFGSMLGMAMPELQQVYTEENCMDWGRKAAQLADHYGAKAGVGLLWCGLIANTLGFAIATGKAIAARRRAAGEQAPQPAGERAAQHVQAEPGPAAAPASGHRVEFG